MSLIGRGAAVTGGQFLGYDGTKTIMKENKIMEDSFRLHIVAAIAAAFCTATFCLPYQKLFLFF